jgi:endonuclease/exonuclease/phosphatase family metal-dependent hydrolase
MLRFLRRLPGRILRLTAFIGIVGIVGSALAVNVSPRSAEYLAFLGLGFPVWLFIATVGLVYALVRRRWLMAVIVVGVFIWHADFIERTIGIGSTDEANGDHDVSVMSYNVRIFDLYNWSEGSITRDKIFNFLDEHPVDVLCFQEFYHTDQEGVFETRDTMVTFLDNVYVHERYTHEMTGQQYFGVVTFSRYPIVERGELAFASDANNYCIYSDILVDDDTLRVYNTHLASIRFQKEDYAALEDGPNSEDAKRLAGRLGVAFRKRATQAEKIAQHIAMSPHPVVLCGDFNDTPVSYAYEILSSGLEDAFTSGGRGLGTTYIGKLPIFRIDYVLHSEDLAVTDFVTHDVRFSDHRPVEAHLNW